MAILREPSGHEYPENIDIKRNRKEEEKEKRKRREIEIVSKRERERETLRRILKTSILRNP